MTHFFLFSLGFSRFGGDSTPGRKRYRCVCIPERHKERERKSEGGGGQVQCDNSSRARVGEKVKEEHCVGIA